VTGADLELYADCLGHLLDASPWAPWDAEGSRNVLRLFELGSDQADEVIAYAIANGHVLLRNGGLRPPRARIALRP
jgi:hypothetical protein